MRGQFADTTKRFDEMNQRFDQVNRELADNRERMAKLEGSLEGFLAGRRDRDAARASGTPVPSARIACETRSWTTTSRPSS